jgi:hypothetical protein
MMGNKQTKTRGFKLTVFLLVLGFIAMPGYLRSSVEISFKLSGSYGSLMDGAGDVEEARTGWESYLAEVNQLDSYTTTFDWKKPKRTNDFRAELMFRISRNFAVSIGSGYLVAKNTGFYTIEYNASVDYGNIYHYDNHEYVGYSQKGTLSAIPITLDAYLLIPIGKNEPLTIFAHVGAGYYFSKLRYDLDMDGNTNYEDTTNNELTYKRDVTQSIQTTEKTNSNSWGYHGGLGLDIKLTRFLTIGAEAYGRQVVFKDWEGSLVSKLKSESKSWSIWSGDYENGYDDTDSTYGSLWTYQVGCSDETNPYTMMWVLDEKPEGSCYQNVRKSSINLNSYGVSVSIKLRFNLF